MRSGDHLRRNPGTGISTNSPKVWGRRSFYFDPELVTKLRPHGPRAAEQSARGPRHARHKTTYAKTDAYEQSRKDPEKVEMLFARLQWVSKLDRLRLRGSSGAQDEFLRVATAQNLTRMAELLMLDLSKQQQIIMA